MDIKVEKKYDFYRVDQFLSEQLGQSRSIIQKQIKRGAILLNGKTIKPSYYIQEHDVFVVSSETVDLQKQLYMGDIACLYEDESIVVLNKPINLVVHTDLPHQDSLCDYLQRKHILNDSVDSRFGIVHRLDKMTEGVMVVAKNQQAMEALKDQFKSRSVHKKYYAVVKGNLLRDVYHINRPISRHTTKRHLYRVDPNGKEAITTVTVLKRFNTKTLCDITIKTGRTHQIRVHLSEMGYPIVGDVEYGRSKLTDGQHLQAYFLSFKHPIHGKQISFEIPLSDRLK